MPPIRHLCVLLPALSLLTPVARAQQPTPAPAHDMHDTPGMADSPDAGAGQAMMQAMQTMNHGMAAAPMTGDPDRDFVAMMIPHHQGAIDMCKPELQYGKDPALLRLCRNIITAQSREIALMRHWQHTHHVAP
jgi:uncharacterized protein (DUF305 family)